MSVKRFEVHPDTVARAIGGVSLWSGPVSVVLASDYDALATKLQTAEAALHEVCGESTESNIVKIAEIALGIYDPTPYCSGCNAMRKADCKCGPIAENE